MTKPAPEWTLRGYRVQNKKLWGLTGSRKTEMQKPIVAAAKLLGVTSDPRVEVPVEQLVDEVLARTLDRTHALA